MATRARIGMAVHGPSVRSIYSHWDGYPTHVGVTLREHYATPEKLTELLGLGDVSVLRSEIGEKHDFDLEHYKLPEDDPRREWTLFYGRDRGEEGIESKTHPLDQWPDYGQEWEYLFNPNADGGPWFCRGLWQDDKSWQPLDHWIEIEKKREAEYLASR